MTGWRFFFVGVLGLWVFGALQQGLSERVSIFGVRPDFLLIFSAAYALLASRGAAAMCGFGAGVVQGALAGANLTHYVFSRTLASASIAWSTDLRFEQNAVLVALSIALGTLFAGLVFMFLAAPSAILEYLGATILSALYNGVLAIPVHSLLRRLLGTALAEGKIGFRR